MSVQKRLPGAGPALYKSQPLVHVRSSGLLERNISLHDGITTMATTRREIHRAGGMGTL